jgi:POT family proton-dependent oligopeptide transporter
MYKFELKDFPTPAFTIKHVDLSLSFFDTFVEGSEVLTIQAPEAPSNSIILDAQDLAITGAAYVFLAAYSYFMGYPSATEARAEGVVLSGPWVLLVLYFFLTVAELFISPLGLSFVSKVAPKHMLGLCQGLWLGATAVGNLLLWIGPLIYNTSPIWVCWTVFLAVCLISMGIMLGMVKWLERVTNA